MRNSAINLIKMHTLIFVSLLLTLSPLVKANKQGEEMVTDIIKSSRDSREYKGIQLKNGMRVLLVSDKKATDSLAALAVPIGSMDDPSKQQGLAHYLEHMILMGSKKYPEAEGFSEFLSEHGGSYNASTRATQTSFYLAIEHKAFNQAVDRLADAIATPLLDPHYADKERNAVNAELTLARSREGLRMEVVNSETINPQHPVAQFFGGNLETLSDKTGSKLQTELVNFYQKYYSANMMVAVLYSNQSLASLEKLANETFGRINNRQATLPHYNMPIVTDKEKSILINYVPVKPEKFVRIDFMVKNNLKDFRTQADGYINYLLSNRGKNTLLTWLQDEGLSDDLAVYASPDQYRDEGVFTIFVSLTDKGLKEREKVVAAIFAYLRQIEAQGISKQYFDEFSHILDLRFQYQSINRDMSYVEWLTGILLSLPFEHVLDGVYLADQYKAEVIQARLQELTPENARVWYISPNEPHNKEAYFIEALYQVQPIAEKTLQYWKTGDNIPKFSLPELNAFIPTDFSLIKIAEKKQKPELILNQQQVRALYMPSYYFADEPKAYVNIALRTPVSENTARNQVLFALTDYMAALSLAELQYQAAVGGIDLSMTEHHGLLVTANGFTQHMPLLINRALTIFRDFKPTQQQLEQGKQYYKDMLDGEEKQSAYNQAGQIIDDLDSLPYFERQTRRNELESITLDDITRYRDTLLSSSTVETLIIGNFTQQQATELSESIPALLKTSGSNKWWHGEKLATEGLVTASLTQRSSSTDAALIQLYVPAAISTDESDSINHYRIFSMARSQILSQILHPWFFEQLRTEEQLGYVVYVSPANIGDQFGIAYTVQSSNKNPTYLYERYLAFNQEAADKLKELTTDEFANYQNSLVTNLEKRPQTLKEEANRFYNDFSRSNYQFDSRQKLIAEIKTLKLADINDFFSQAVLKQSSGIRLLSQVIGRDGKEADFVSNEQWLHYGNVSALQQKLIQQEIP